MHCFDSRSVPVPNEEIRKLSFKLTVPFGNSLIQRYMKIWIWGYGGSVVKPLQTAPDCKFSSPGFDSLSGAGFPQSPEGWVQEIPVPGITTLYQKQISGWEASLPK
jgi:hypothetical protein